MTEETDEGEATTTVDEPPDRATADSSDEETDATASADANVERVDVEPVADADPEQSEGRVERAIDNAAESFVTLERQLHSGDPEGPIRGRAVDVERVPAEEVPEDYPLELSSQEALAMEVVTDDRREGSTVVYFEWPPSGPDGPLARLLSLRDIPREQFANLHGQPISLRVQDGHYVPDVPEESPRGYREGYYGVVGGVGVNVVVGAMTVLGIANLLPAFPLVVLLLLVNFVVLPVSTYLDGWYLRTHTDWDQGPVFWASLAFIVGLNVFSSLAYLATRRSADSI